MKNALMLRLALILAALCFAGSSLADDATAETAPTPSVSEASLEGPEQMATEVPAAPQASKRDCPAKAPTALLPTAVAVLEPSEPAWVQKICVVDCEPCNTNADCEFGPCKAIQCP